MPGVEGPLASAGVQGTSLFISTVISSGLLSPTRTDMDLGAEVSGSGSGVCSSGVCSLTEMGLGMGSGDTTEGLGCEGTDRTDGAEIRRRGSSVGAGIDMLNGAGPAGLGAESSESSESGVSDCTCRNAQDRNHGSRARGSDR